MIWRKASLADRTANAKLQGISKFRNQGCVTGKWWHRQKRKYLEVREAIKDRAE